jgi:hypothetical protein
VEGRALNKICVISRDRHIYGRISKKGFSNHLVGIILIFETSKIVFKKKSILQLGDQDCIQPFRALLEQHNYVPEIQD